MFVHDTLASLGWDERFSADFIEYDGAVPARVVGVDRGAVDVLTADNPLRVELGHNDPSLAVGDWVALAAREDRRWVVEALLPRRSALARASVTGESAQQVIAANINLVLIVLSAVPEPRPALAQRFVALGWDSGATPVIVVSKSDLTPESASIAADLAESVPGVDVITVSAATPGGLETLAPYVIPGHTLCLVGKSGAGKSTLANALLDEDRFAVTAVRDDGKGRHTTVRRELVQLPNGALLIDTPGLRGGRALDQRRRSRTGVRGHRGPGVGLPVHRLRSRDRARLRGARRGRRRPVAATPVGQLAQAAARSPLDGLAQRRPDPR
jgi:ribosome biogenesis GTPase